VSEKLPRLTAKELIRVLEQRGWEHDRSRGSHHIYVHVATRRTLSIPVARRAMSIGTLSRLLKDAGISREELRKLL
jgi:predicted RNA binding protein YcfA (HicA-like mRNA interferase family)